MSRDSPPRPVSDRLLAVIWGDHLHCWDPEVARRRRLAVSGALAITAAAALISAIHAVTTPPFAPPDETSHIHYAFALLDGRIPWITDHPEAQPLPYMRGMGIWVANHPPLPYALLAVPLSIGQAVDAPLVGFYVARLLLVGSAAVGNLMVGWFALLLLPRRPGAAVVATGVAALVPYALHVAGMAYTDAMGFGVVTALLVAALIMVQRGVTWPRLALLTALGIVAANTRAVGLAAAAGCIGCVAIAELVHGRGRRMARTLRAIAMAGGAGAAVLASSLWFYVGVNLVRYESLSGTSALMELHGREPVGSSVLARIVDPGHLWLLNTQFWRQVEADATREVYLPGVLTSTGRWLLGLTLLAALLFGVWRLARGTWRQPLVLSVGWAVAVGWFVTLHVAMASFVQVGGSAHLRYLWPALGVVAVVVTVGVTALPRRWGAVASIVFIGYQAVCAAVILANLILRESVAPEPERVAVRALVVESPRLALALLAAAALVGLAAFLWWVRAVVALVPHDDRSHLSPPTEAWTVAVPLGRGHVRVNPLDVVLATVAGTAGGWLAGAQLGVEVPLPALAGVIAIAAVAVNVAARSPRPSAPEPEGDATPQPDAAR